jgi:hypothetical protein
LVYENNYQGGRTEFDFQDGLWFSRHLIQDADERGAGAHQEDLGSHPYIGLSARTYPHIGLTAVSHRKFNKIARI